MNKKQTQSVPIESQDYINQLKEDDKLYLVEFEYADGTPSLRIKEFDFKKYLAKNTHIEGLEVDEESVLAEIVDPKFEKVLIKTDISKGYFRSPKDAAQAFLQFSKDLYEAVQEAYDKQFS